MNNRGVLVVVSGFSGSGKGTVMKELLNRYDDYSLSISATTRQPREGEVNGREYFFLTKEEFESMINNNALAEWAEYVSNYYGTPKKYLEEQMEAGRKVILEIEIQGALKVKEQYPDAVLVFLTPPGFSDLKDRLIGRGTEDINTVNKRLSRASEEAEYIKYYDYLIINDSLDECVEEVNDIICNEQKKAVFNNEYLAKFIKESNEYKKGV